MKNQRLNKGQKLMILYCCMYDECGGVFGTKFNLKRHVQTTHKKIKKFSCEHCDKRFASKQTLMEHTFIHTGERPFVCAVCDVAFRQASQLSLHKRKEHKNLLPVLEKRTPQTPNPRVSEEQDTPIFNLPVITDQPQLVRNLPSLFN